MEEFDMTRDSDLITKKYLLYTHETLGKLINIHEDIPIPVFIVGLLSTDFMFLIDKTLTKGEEEDYIAITSGLKMAVDHLIEEKFQK